MSVPANRQPAPSSAERAGRARRRFGLLRGGRGQSLVEFSVVLPVLLALVGIVIDASRLYTAWVNLESATRDAAQYLARSDTDPYASDYTWAGADADAKAAYILETALNVTFDASPSSGTLVNCEDEPEVTTTYSLDTSWNAGGSVANPLSTAKVSACVPFRTLFQYPFITTNGVWVLQSEREMTVIVGR
jgi:Flp pilus assembly protein TadG